MSQSPHKPANMKLNMVAHMEVDKVADWQQKMADMEMDMVADNKKSV